MMIFLIWLFSSPWHFAGVTFLIGLIGVLAIWLVESIADVIRRVRS